jgi:hypothetical protein
LEANQPLEADVEESSLVGRPAWTTDLKIFKRRLPDHVVLATTRVFVVTGVAATALSCTTPNTSGNLPSTSPITLTSSMRSHMHSRNENPWNSPCFFHVNPRIDLRHPLDAIDVIMEEILGPEAWLD